MATTQVIPGLELAHHGSLAQSALSFLKHEIEEVFESFEMYCFRSMVVISSVNSNYSPENCVLSNFRSSPLKFFSGSRQSLQ